MSAELLREAAAKIRERAEAAKAADNLGDSWVAGPRYDPDNNGWMVALRPEVDGFDDLLVTTPYDYEGSLADHLAGWHPAVALAVADLLDAAVARNEFGWELGETPELDPAALSVARAYLGAT